MPVSGAKVTQMPTLDVEVTWMPEEGDVARTIATDECVTRDVDAIDEFLATQGGVTAGVTNDQAAKASVMTTAGDVAHKSVKACVARVLHVSSESRALLDVAVDGDEGDVGVFVPHAAEWDGAMVVPTVARVRDGRVRVAVLNTAAKRVRLPEGADLGTWLPVTADMELIEMDGGLETDAVMQWLHSVKTGGGAPVPGEDDIKYGDLTPAEEQRFRELLRCYPELFHSGGQPTKTTLPVEHHIPTGTAAPIFQRRLRGSQAENGIIAAEVEKMLKDGVIEAGHGAWGFPVVLVKKKDGTTRFCVDYRSLNAVTTKDVYPLPRIDETLEAVGGSRWFTTLAAGYWQVGVAEVDEDKTAFVTRQGLFRFVRMPFMHRPRSKG